MEKKLLPTLDNGSYINAVPRSSCPCSVRSGGLPPCSERDLLL
jgi:hypothetical protein